MKESVAGRAGSSEPTKSVPIRHVKLWMFASFVVFACVVALIIILLIWADRITAFGLTTSFYYVALVILGLCAAGFLFGGLRTYARYSGHVLGGTLELGGPAVVAVLVAVLGLLLAPPSQTFDLVVRVHGPGGTAEIVRTGSLTADFGVDRRVVPINSDGQAHFNGLPSSNAARPVVLIPDVKGYTAKTTAPQTIPRDHVLYLELASVSYSSIIHGRLQDASGGAVRHALLSVDNGLITAFTDDQGEFRFSVPFEEGHRIRLTASLNGRIGYDNDVTVPVGTTLRFEGEKQ